MLVLLVDGEGWSLWVEVVDMVGKVPVHTLSILYSLDWRPLLSSHGQESQICMS